MKVPASGAVIGAEEKLAMHTVVERGWLTAGAVNTEFENRLGRFTGHRHVRTCNSGSSANLLAVAAMVEAGYWKAGDEIITTACGFPTTVNPLLLYGLVPVFVDIELGTYNTTQDWVAETGAVKAMLAHTLGNPFDIQFEEYLIEDCCDALGSTYDGKALGSFGEMSSCSFYPAHHITMGEGGFIATRTKDQEMVIKSLREWGRGCYCSGKAASCLKNGMCKRRFSNWLPSLPDEVFDHKYVYEEIGYNLKPLDLQAAMGLVQLDKLDKIIDIRKRNYSLLIDVFGKYEEFFHLPKATAKSDPAWFAFPLTIRDGSPFKRTDLTMFLEDSKIQTRNYFGGNILLQPGYSEVAPHIDAKTAFPVATKVTKDTFFLGTSPVITEEQIGYIGKKVDQFFQSVSI